MDFLRSQLRLCLMVDLDSVRSGLFADRYELLAETGVTTLFLRVDPDTLSPRDEDLLLHLTQSWQSAGGYVFATDDALLALKLGCHGVYARHPRQSLARLREILGEGRFLGLELSSHGVLEAQPGSSFGAEAFESVDFFGIGPVLQFGEKPCAPMGVDMAKRQTRAARGKPVFWHGGIRADDLEGFGTGFADGVAVVRALAGDDVVAEARRMHVTLGRALGPTRYSVGHPPADVSFQFSALSANDLRGEAVPLPAAVGRA